MTSDVTIRPAGPDDAPLVDRVGASVRAVAIIAEGPDGARLAGVIDPAGSVTEQDAPALRIADQKDHRDLLPALVTALIEAAATTGADRLVVAWDTMDVAGQRVFTDLGFRPTGTQPYFERGPDVEFVSGYTDPTGSTVDLARTLP